MKTALVFLLWLAMFTFPLWFADWMDKKTTLGIMAGWSMCLAYLAFFGRDVLKRC